MKQANSNRDVRLLVAALALVAGATCVGTPLRAAEPTKDSTATTVQTTPGERVPSEDSIVKDLHSLGLVEGHTNVFRSACPVRDLAEAPSEKMSDAQKQSEARSRMKHLHDLGVRTI